VSFCHLSYVVEDGYAASVEKACTI
jgi:hypothetical protein